MFNISYSSSFIGNMVWKAIMHYHKKDIITKTILKTSSFKKMRMHRCTIMPIIKIIPSIPNLTSSLQMFFYQKFVFLWISSINSLQNWICLILSSGWRDAIHFVFFLIFGHQDMSIPNAPEMLLNHSTCRLKRSKLKFTFFLFSFVDLQISLFYIAKRGMLSAKMCACYQW